jgi:hypothetical protein
VSASGSGSTGGGRRFAAWMRWLHIYGSMLGLVALLFFSLTGITLNHPDWTFGGVRRQEEVAGALELAWVRAELPEERVGRLEVVEHLRRRHGVRGAVEEFRLDDREVLVAFKGPGYSADAFVDRETGAYRLIVVREGAVALLNDLHKGRHTGRAWAWVIDLSAVVMALIAATGLALLLYLRRRRMGGLIAGVAGGVILGVIVRWLVP